jgi:agarase
VRYCDVVSFNAYDLTPSQWRADLKTLNAPVLISEYSFGASDLGRSGGTPCAVTENDRVAAYQGYIADAMTWPNLVGMHWYKWEDEPVTGRMWDNSNAASGLVSITDVPYSQMIDAVTQANLQLNNRLLTP